MINGRTSFTYTLPIKFIEKTSLIVRSRFTRLLLIRLLRARADLKETMTAFVLLIFPEESLAIGISQSEVEV